MSTRGTTSLFILLIFAGLFIVGCNKESVVQLSPYEQYKVDSVIIQNYIIENQLDAFDVEYDGKKYGVFCAILEEGTNEPGVTPSLNADVTVKYKGYLVNGKVFDQTEDGDSAKFNLAGVIVGWKLGFTALSKGDKATLIIPSYYGYGSVSQGRSIPANSVLIFDVELLNFTK
jgi:FKBP-type peptidyl-prolyl cis-trans isomerase FkpA